MQNTQKYATQNFEKYDQIMERKNKLAYENVLLLLSHTFNRGVEKYNFFFLLLIYILPLVKYVYINKWKTKKKNKKNINQNIYFLAWHDFHSCYFVMPNTQNIVGLCRHTIILQNLYYNICK